MSSKQSKRKLLDKFDMIHKQRYFIDKKLEEIGLYCNSLEQLSLINERNHIEYREIYLDRNNKLCVKFTHCIKPKYDPKLYFNMVDVYDKEDKNGLYIYIE